MALDEPVMRALAVASAALRAVGVRKVKLNPNWRWQAGVHLGVEHTAANPSVISVPVEIEQALWVALAPVLDGRPLTVTPMARCIEGQQVWPVKKMLQQVSAEVEALVKQLETLKAIAKLAE